MKIKFTPLDFYRDKPKKQSLSSMVLISKVSKEGEES